MNLILLFPEDFVGDTGRVCLRGRRHRHVLEIHKIKPGQTLFVGLAGGRMGEGRVTRIDKTCLEMETELVQEPPKPAEVTLCLALPRPIVLKRILLCAATLGIKKIFLVNTRRVEKSFWRSHALRENDIDEQLILGLEQAKDTVMPQVFLRKRFKPFVEDELPDLSKDTLALTAHPEAARDCPRRVRKPVTLFIGPEGGLIPYEIEKLESIGFVPVSLGQRILKVETALVALVSRLS